MTPEHEESGSTAPKAPEACPAAPIPIHAPPSPVPAAKVTVDALCAEIRQYEGFEPGMRAYRNNNPGNCRFNPNGYFSIYGHVTEDRAGAGTGQNGFAVFESYEKGWLYFTTLVRQITSGTNKRWNATAQHDYALRSSADLTLAQFFAIYSPSSDHNDPDAYAKWVGDKLGVDYKTFKLHTIV